MGHDELKFGVQVRKFVIITIRICYRSVCNHPFWVGTLMFLFFLYRSSPFLFSLLVSTSPVLVCTAVLLGTLLSFGESNIPLIEEEDEKISAEIVLLKTGWFENPTVVEKDEGFGKEDSSYTELKREVVERSIDEEPLIDSSVDRFSKLETDNNDVAISSLSIDQGSREMGFGKQVIDETSSEFENLDIEQKVDLDHQETPVGVEVGLSHDEVVEDRLSRKVQVENFEDYKSAEGSVDAQVRDELESSSASWKQLDEVLEDSLSPVQKIQAAIHARIRDHLESSLRSWKQLDEEVVEDRSLPVQRVQAENYEDYRSAEGSVDVLMRDQLESSLGSWKQFDSDRDGDGDDESDSGSDGAESSSPDASMADIIPMLDELHPLLDEEIPQTSNMSRQSSAATMARSEKSRDSSIHSDDESDQTEEEEAGDTKSDADDDADEDDEETQKSKPDPAKSAITWTEDDQKNLMDLGTSELERNQRLESLIARRRARRNLTMMTERNLIDLDGMDLQFQVAPISTTRQNPFDYPYDSYDDLGLPPIPGSAPSILLPRRNPFDLPYDSSEEKPDLTGDSFQQEFMELSQRETSNQREPIFRRNETFSIGSSIFDFGRHDGRDGARPSRFRPYFIPERTDSDVMSYSSLQRQSSELSESKVSSAAETESVSAFGDEEEKKRIEHESAQEMEPNTEIDHVSLYVEQGSRSSEDEHSLSDEENEDIDFVVHVPEIELGGAGNFPAAPSHASETDPSADVRLEDREIHPEAESWMSQQDISTGDIDLMTESIEEKESNVSSSLLMPKEFDEVKHEEVDNESLVNEEHREVSNVENAEISMKKSLEKSVSDIPSESSQGASDFSHGTELDDSHPKEPVYDSSPQAIRKNHSSVSSDLQMETSEIDFYHIVREDSLPREQSKALDEDTEQNAVDRKQGIDEDDLTMNQPVEADEHDVSEFRFPEINQHSLTSGASLVPEYEVHWSKSSSDTGLVNDQLLDDEVYPQEVGRVSTQEDDDVLMQGKHDALKSEDDMVYKASEDPVLAPEKGEISVFADQVSPVQSISYFEVSEGASMEREGDPQLLASSSDSKNHEDEKQVSPFEESHDFPRDSTVHDVCNDQETYFIHRSIEEVGLVNKVDEEVVLVQDPQGKFSHDLPQSDDERPCQPDEFEIKPAAGSTDEEHLHHNISQEPGSSGADQNILYDFTSDIKEMDDDLLSELDVVGDFSVKDMGPDLNSSVAYSNAEPTSSTPEQVVGELHSRNGVPFPLDTLLEANTDAENLEDARELTEPKISGFEEMHLDSHVADGGTGFPVLEAQSITDIDAALERVSEGEAQNSVVNEPVQAELTKPLIDVPYQEHELSVEDTEAGIHVSEGVSLNDDDGLNRTEWISGGFSSDLASMERHNLESCRREDDTGFVLDAEITKQDDTEFETIVETKTDNLNVIENLPAAAETGESAPLQADKGIDDVQELPVVESTLPAVGSGAQVERVEIVESEPLQIDRDIKERQELPVMEAHIAPAVELGAQVERYVVESEPLHVEGDIEDKENLPVTEMSIAPAVDSSAQVESVGFVEPEPLVTEKDIKEMQELPVIDTSIAPAVESNDQTERVGYVDSESFYIDEDIKEGVEVPVLEPSIVASTESRDQTESPDFAESESSLIDRDIQEMQESSVVEASIAPSVESDSRTERPGFVDSESSLMDRDIKDMQVSPATEHDDPTKRPSLVDSQSLLSDRDINEIRELPAESKHQTERVASVEAESPSIDRDIKEMQESPVVEANIVMAIESEDQTGVGSLEPKLSQSDADINGIQEYPVVESENQREVGQHVGVVQAEALHVHQSASQQQPDDLQLITDDSKGVDTLKANSATSVSESTDQKYGVQGSTDNAILQEIFFEK